MQDRATAAQALRGEESGGAQRTSRNRRSQHARQIAQRNRLHFHRNMAENGRDGFEPGTQGHPAIMVRDYDTLIDRLHTAGHDVRRDPGSPGPRNFQTDDPFGNRIQFIAF